MDNINLALTIGAILGSLAAISTKRAESVRDGFLRFICGIALSICFTCWTCDLIGIICTDYEKVIAVASFYGFAGWHVMTCVMLVLDNMVSEVNENKKTLFNSVSGFISNWIKGKKT